jgi:hypothetical protein
MDEEKKSGSSEEEAARVGPYQLQEQVPQEDDSQRSVYRGTHETTGAQTLVLEPAAQDEDKDEEEGAEPPSDVRVRIISSASQGYDAMEVEQTPWSVAPERQSVESLVSTLEDVHQAVGRMVEALSPPPEPRPRRHLGLTKWMGIAAVCALTFVLGRHVPVSQPPSGPESVESVAPAPMRHEVLADEEPRPMGNSWIVDTEDGGTPALAYPFPSKPYKGQRRPPCKPRVEVEIMGACWVPHELKAPCPEELYEYQGKCYTTSMKSPQTPQSVEE